MHTCTFSVLFSQIFNATRVKRENNYYMEIFVANFEQNNVINITNDVVILLMIITN